MKPIVGVMPLWDDEKNSIWMLPGYMDGVSMAGGLPVIFPFTSDEDELGRLTDMCDGFLFTGGQDVSPAIYNEEAIEGLVDCCEKRDAMESMVLDMAMRAGKPVLGICRGMQFINAALGGTLYQDIPLQYPSKTQHRQPAPYDVPSHSVAVMADSPLFSLSGAERLQVNSCHHQAVKALADGLKIMAVAPDGIAEALYMPSQRFLWAVQWHPEFSYKRDEFSRKIFGAFVDAMI